MKEEFQVILDALERQHPGALQAHKEEEKNISLLIEVEEADGTKYEDPKVFFGSESICIEFHSSTMVYLGGLLGWHYCFPHEEEKFIEYIKNNDVFDVLVVRSE